jgi:3-oxoacyl-[acyl-carrier-protein] synthase-3
VPYQSGFTVAQIRLFKNTQGVLERRVAWAEETISSMAIEVVRNLQHALNLRGRDFGGLVLSSSYGHDVQKYVRDIARAVNIPSDAPVEGVHASCSGFAAATVKALRMAEKTDKHVLVLSSEQMTRMTDYRREEAMLFGDFAAGSTIIQNGRHQIHDAFCREEEDEGRLIGSTVIHDALDVHGRTARRTCVDMPGGKGLYRLVPQKMIDLTLESIAHANLQRQQPWTLEDVAVFNPHQANGKMLEKLKKLLEGMQWESQPPTVHIRLDQTGNTASASIPAALAAAELNPRGIFFPGALVACPVVGAGPDLQWGKLTVGNILFTWGE